MMAVHAGTLVVKVDRRFGVAEAVRVRETVDRVAPLREVRIELGGSVIEDTALLVIAELMKAHPGCRFELGGLTHHGRRLLRYMGAPEPRALRAAMARNDLEGTAAVREPAPQVHAISHPGL